jgi:lactoylglutathione lyase
MTLSDVIGEYAFVAKVDVSDLNISFQWYSTKLGLTPDPRYNTKTWMQINLPGIPNVAIGLNLSPTGTGTGGAVSTFVVQNINTARNGLLEQGVNVGPIIEASFNVLLCFFKDPDGNMLGLRQNLPIPTA